MYAFDHNIFTLNFSENGEGDENKRVTEKSTKRKVKAEEGDEKKSVKGKKNASKKGSKLIFNSYIKYCYFWFRKRKWR